MSGTSPPKCECGIYAIGECVDCGLALCADHGAKVLDRFRCEKDGRKAVKAQRKYEREHAAEDQARAEAEAERARAKQAAREAAAVARATKKRQEAEAKARERRHQAEAEAAIEQEREKARAREKEQRRRREADAASRARAEASRVRRWSAVGIPTHEAGPWRSRHFSPDEAKRWIGIGLSAEDAWAWRINEIEPDIAALFVAAGMDAPAAVRWQASGNTISALRETGSVERAERLTALLATRKLQGAPILVDGRCDGCGLVPEYPSGRCRCS